MQILTVEVKDAFGTYRGEGRLYLPEEIMYAGDYDLKRELEAIFPEKVICMMPTRNAAMPWRLEIVVH